MTDADATERHQEVIHEALAELELEPGELLTGWVVLYETRDTDGGASAGHFYGPEGMTPWRALGLVEWAARHTIRPDPEEEGDG